MVQNRLMRKAKSILLHTCCAPCAIGLVRELISRGISPNLFFFNPNVHPYSEFQKRLRAVEVMAEAEKLPLHARSDYGLERFLYEVMGTTSQTSYVGRDISGCEKFELSNLRPPMRCERCYWMRLQMTASFAHQNGFTVFTTSLLVSPRQNHELIRNLGHTVGKESGVEFLYEDFRHLYEVSRELAKKKSLYLQRYCGCVFSEYEQAIATPRKVITRHKCSPAGSSRTPDFSSSPDNGGATSAT